MVIMMTMRVAMQMRMRRLIDLAEASDWAAQRDALWSLLQCVGRLVRSFRWGLKKVVSAFGPSLVALLESESTQVNIGGDRGTLDQCEFAAPSIVFGTSPGNARRSIGLILIFGMPTNSSADLPVCAR